MKRMERFVERLLQAVAIAVVLLATMQIHDARAEQLDNELGCARGD